MLYYVILYYSILMYYIIVQSIILYCASGVEGHADQLPEVSHRLQERRPEPKTNPPR